MLAFTTSRTPLGCQEDAERALWGQLPELGHGVYKTVYRAGDVVYKVPRRGTQKNTNNVIAEAAWAAFGRRRRVPGIPHVTVYRFGGSIVVAMPFMPNPSGTSHDYAEVGRRRRRWTEMGLRDLHSENLRCDSHGRLFVTDLGGYGDDAPLHVLPSDVCDAYDEDANHDECECSACGPQHSDMCAECGYCQSCDGCHGRLCKVGKEADDDDFVED